jgi:hypothetical protein
MIETGLHEPSASPGLVIWATASLALLAIIYAPKERLVWSDTESAWLRGPLQLPRQKNPEPRRDFIWIIPDEACQQCPYQAWKMVADWSRLGGELVLVLGIGGGLEVCLRERH